MDPKWNRWKIPVVAILLLAIGTGWLLTAHQIIPGVNFAWILSLAVVGLLIPAVAGLDKVTVTTGPFLVISSLYSFLRQIDVVGIKTEVPALVMSAGALLLIPRFFKLPPPQWLLDDEPAVAR